MKLGIVIVLLANAAEATAKSCRTKTTAPTMIQLSSPLSKMNRSARRCDTGSWPDKDHGLACGECKVLVDQFDTKYLNCDGYCSSIGLQCVGAWEEEDDTCTVLHDMSCNQQLASSDAICECRPSSDADDSQSSGASGRRECDTESWPDKDHGLVCGKCKVLVDKFDSKYRTCTRYCARLGRQCVAAWEEEDDNCQVLHDLGCDDALESSDAICECSETATDPEITVEDVCYKPLSGVVPDEGNDVGSKVETSSAAECEASCTRTGDCHSFTLCRGWNACWMKDKELVGTEATRKLADCKTYYKSTCDATDDTGDHSGNQGPVHNWVGTSLQVTHYWDCNGQACDGATLRPWDQRKFVASPGYGPQDPNNFQGGSKYGEKMWITGAASDALSQLMGADDGCCGQDQDRGGCGKCVLIQNPDSVNSDWTAVVMKKNRCPPWSAGCDKVHLDLAIPGFDDLQWSTANICGQSGTGFSNQQQSEAFAKWWESCSNIADCAYRCDSLPSSLRDGCKLFASWGWKRGNPSGVKYKPVECPPEFVRHISVQFTANGPASYVN